MAAKTITEALLKSNIKHEIKAAVCIGPLFELVARIEKAEAIIIKNAKGELRDYFAHRVMILGDKATATELFEDVFSKIPACKVEEK